jgi:hypothetical protein
MKHASGEALNKISALLVIVRTQVDLKERKPGIFYKKAQAFLHFHEDPSGIFADLKIGVKFIRFPINNCKEWDKFISAFHRTLKS